jgi:hypothetical protein
MANPISPQQQNSDLSAHTSSSSGQFIYSFSDASSSHPTSNQSDCSSTRVNIVSPSNKTDKQVEDEKSHLLSQLHNLRQQSSHQSLQYERAIRRALLENEYVRKINVKLVTKLNSLEEDSGGVKSSLQMLDSVVQQSGQTFHERDG